MKLKQPVASADTATSNGETRSRSLATAPALGTILLGWALFYMFGHVIRFGVSPVGVFNWWDFATDANWRSDFLEQARVGGLLGWLESLWKYPWRWDLGRVEWLALGFATFMAALYALVGYCVVNCVSVFVPKHVKYALYFIFGIGVMTLVLEPLAMLDILRPTCGLADTGAQGVAKAFVSRAPVTLAFAGTLAVFWWLSLRHERRAAKQILEHSDARVVSLACENIAAERLRLSLMPLRGVSKIVWWGGMGLIGFHIAMTFFHGLFFAETYWDSLILYMGYARMTFEQGGFPFKAVAQVGYGLGANYPHLYPLMNSTTATLFGSWNDALCQLTAPLCGLLSTVVVYYLALEIAKDRLAAVAAALLFRAPLYSIAYHQYASDYAVAILFTVGLLYLCWKYLETALPSYRTLAAFIAAFAMHINYLMGFLWIVWGLTLILTHFRRSTDEDNAPRVLDMENELESYDLPEFTFDRYAPNLRGLLTRRRFWTVFFVAVLLGSTWNLRNWALTGNPVYAFFYNVFGGVNYNEEVMASADFEWTQNGDGIGGYAWQVFRNSYRHFENPNATDAEIWALWKSQGKLAELSYKARVSPGFWLRSGNHADKFGPVIQAVGAPTLALWCGMVAVAWLRRRAVGPEWRFGWVAGFVVFFLLAFHYVLGDYYQYQILPILPAMSIGMAGIYRMWPARLTGFLLVAVAALPALLPGAPFALGGFKGGTGKVRRQVVVAAPEMFPLRHLGLPAEEMRRLRYDHDVTMWNYINERLRAPEGQPGPVILTHENRHVVFDPTFTLFHLDEPEIQALWDKPERERQRALRDMTILESDQITRKQGIAYYLYTPNERNHPINLRLGMQEWVDQPFMERVFVTVPHDIRASSWQAMTPEQRARCNVLYRFNWNRWSAAAGE